VRHVIPGKGRYPAVTHGSGSVEDARRTVAMPVIPAAPPGSSREESAICAPAVPVGRLPFLRRCLDRVLLPPEPSVTLIPPSAGGSLPPPWVRRRVPS
jgi:hypothetical protein